MQPIFLSVPGCYFQLGLFTTLYWSELLLADSLFSSNDRSNSRCERSLANSERSDANLKQKIACDFRIANEVEMGLYSAHA